MVKTVSQAIDDVSEPWRHRSIQRHHPVTSQELVPIPDYHEVAQVSHLEGGGLRDFPQHTMFMRRWSVSHAAIAVIKGDLFYEILLLISLAVCLKHSLWSFKILNVNLNFF